MLDEVNIAMIEVVREMLGITTPLLVTEPPTKGSTDRLIEQVKMVGGTTYLAGQGGPGLHGRGRRKDSSLRKGWTWSGPITSPRPAIPSSPC